MEPVDRLPRRSSRAARRFERHLLARLTYLARYPLSSEYDDQFSSFFPQTVARLALGRRFRAQSEHFLRKRRAKVQL